MSRMSRLPDFLWSFDPESLPESTFAVAGSEIWFGQIPRTFEFGCEIGSKRGPATTQTDIR